LLAALLISFKKEVEGNWLEELIWAVALENLFDNALDAALNKENSPEEELEPKDFPDGFVNE
jgi:sensor histidine kinase regulating citrate/malate metabolism